ncbi:MAG: type II toxin-antitoxin system RelE/ParE family toxin [Deltaproteobacteria bacterium]|nr:type II toxin-antitoxin system RelE/ParE family toxin [Deltaproteobacteria bacterium]MBW1794131.1 type II toxin-antitoxin system RelE/ParE family toxin [Deltaproteobacteria bacterium]MBW2330856.1 type II toxin-antitoxin system RelE/ParE family toxin [Deltaproteobacteria bacterium]
MKVRFVSPANIELDEAVRYYDHQLPGLGFRFYQEVDAAIERIRLMPEAWTKIGKHTRRCILKGFPYGLLYAIEIDEILITAVAHLHRDPEHYKDRIV